MRHEQATFDRSKFWHGLGMTAICGLAVTAGAVVETALLPGMGIGTAIAGLGAVGMVLGFNEMVQAFPRLASETTRPSPV